MRKLIVVLLAALPLVAQMRESISVTAIEVPVTIVDRSGQPIRGLTKDKFELFVDGKRTAITGFETIDLSTIDEQTPLATPLPKAAYRNFVLLFDSSGSTPGTMKRAQTAALEFVTKQMKRRDLCAVATFNADRGTQLLTSFTSDRELLQHVINNLIQPESIKVPDPLRIAAPLRTGVVPQAGQRSIRAQERAEDKRETEREQAIGFNVRAEQAHRDSMRGRLGTQLADFGKLARVIDKQPGQKQIILLSEGFDDSLVQGKTAVEGSKTLTARDTDDTQQYIDRGELWKVRSEDRFGSSHSAFEIREMAQLFKRSDVILHAIDIKGLRGDIDIAAGLQKTSNEGLFLITRPTGGTVFENATDLRKNFDEMLKQQDYVYILVFEAKRTFQEDGFHEITVKVPSARGGRVTHRAGFYEESPYPPSQFEQTLSLASVLMTEADRNDVPLTITASPLASQEQVPIVIEVSGEELVKQGADNIVTADLYVYAFDMQNNVRDFLQQRLGVDLARNGEKLRSGGLRYVSTLDLPPGKYMIKALVRVDESGRIGLTRRAIEVPDAKVSATFLLPVQSGVNIAAPGRSDVAMMAFGRAVPIAHPVVRDSAQFVVFGAERRTGFSPSHRPGGAD